MRFPLLLLAVALVLPLAPAPAQAATTTIQPGDMIVIDGSAVCTINFVYDGTGALAGKVYVGTAAHCIEGHRAATIDHYTGRNVAGTSNGGYALGVVDAPSFATVAYIGDYPDSVNGGAAVENGIPGTQLDFALLEVKPLFVPRVAGELRGHPGMPSGVLAYGSGHQGDVLVHSGHGTAYSDVQVLRENHYGILTSMTTREYVEEGTTLPGDSGGPIVHQATGKALGVVSGNVIGVGVPPYKDYGPTIQGILAEIGSLGYPVALRTAA